MIKYIFFIKNMLEIFFSDWPTEFIDTSFLKLLLLLYFLVKF